VRRPRLDYESRATALDRNELGALLVAAGLRPPSEHALISLLALNGLRVSEATGADIEHLGLQRGHRTLTITRKGGKVVTIPLAPRTARASFENRDVLEAPFTRWAPEGATMRGCVRSATSSTAAGAVAVSYRHRPHTWKSSQTVLTAAS
jgi:integrase